VSLSSARVAIRRATVPVIIAGSPIALRAICVGVFDTGRLIKTEVEVALRRAIVVDTGWATGIVRRLGSIA
jgi:hypothetical protein